MHTYSGDYSAMIPSHPQQKKLQRTRVGGYQAGGGGWEHLLSGCRVSFQGEKVSVCTTECTKCH